MTTLTVENNRITAGNSGEPDFTGVGFTRARHTAEMARAMAMAELFGKLLARKAAKEDGTAHLPADVDFTSAGYLHARRTAEIARAKVVADFFGKFFAPKAAPVEPPPAASAGPFDGFSLAQRERMGRAMAIGEALGNGLKAIARFFSNASAGAKAAAAAETIDMSRFAHLSRHEQAEIARALAVSESISAVLAGAERFVRDVLIAPVGRYLSRQRLVTELSGLSDRTLADIGFRRIDITTVAQDAYPIYMPESGVGLEGVAANDDDARRHVA